MIHAKKLAYGLKVFLLHNPATGYGYGTPDCFNPKSEEFGRFQVVPETVKTYEECMFKGDHMIAVNFKSKLKLHFLFVNGELHQIKGDGPRAHSYIICESEEHAIETATALLKERFEGSSDPVSSLETQIILQNNAIKQAEKQIEKAQIQLEVLETLLVKMENMKENPLAYVSVTESFKVIPT